ncbi:MAG: HPr family phosphocarrier protein [Spiroplasma ixodetis]|nr:HPr family phosphocarrier protein [Spiroplasma ixodetis]MBP1526968.1 HPr family phosphocarrier protein [Spiroplasma ixodetis]MBP1528164.1 HPr family phosphocarrier protein [Spiroplasma ixodetis]
MNCIIYAVQIDDEKKIGLHARPIAKIAGAISKYKNIEVEVIKLPDNADITKPVKLTGNETKVKAKSVLNFLGLQAKNFSKIAFIITKMDEKEEDKKLEEVKTEIISLLKEEKLIK